MKENLIGEVSEDCFNKITHPVVLICAKTLSTGSEITIKTEH